MTRRPVTHPVHWQRVYQAAGGVQGHPQEHSWGPDPHHCSPHHHLGSGRKEAETVKHSPLHDKPSLSSTWHLVLIGWKGSPLQWGCRKWPPVFKRTSEIVVPNNFKNFWIIDNQCSCQQRVKSPQNNQNLNKRNGEPQSLAWRAFSHLKRSSNKSAWALVLWAFESPWASEQGQDHQKNPWTPIVVP